MQPESIHQKLDFFDFDNTISISYIRSLGILPRYLFMYYPPVLPYLFPCLEFSFSFNLLLCFLNYEPLYSGNPVIVTMAVYLKTTGKKIIDRSRLSEEELAYEKQYPLRRALVPWIFLVVIILALNIPKDIFNLLYRTLKLPVMGLTPDGKPLDTRALWQAYTWIFVSMVLGPS